MSPINEMSQEEWDEAIRLFSVPADFLKENDYASAGLSESMRAYERYIRSKQQAFVAAVNDAIINEPALEAVLDYYTDPNSPPNRARTIKL